MIQRLQFKVGKARVDDRREGRNEAKRLTLNAAVDLSPTPLPAESFVIQTKDGDETYWALTHPAPDQIFTCGKALF